LERELWLLTLKYRQGEEDSKNLLSVRKQFTSYSKGKYYIFELHSILYNKQKLRKAHMAVLKAKIIGDQIESKRAIKNLKTLWKYN